MNQKIFKNEFNIFRQSKGSVAVIVLIIGIVVILAVSTMSAFMIKDIKFNQIDEQKLKALNIAEAGISNMFLNIIKYLKKEIISLPSNPYTGNVMSNGIEAGSYSVSYTISKSGTGLMSKYTIVSKGTDKSGQQRTVRVSIVIASQYNFLFSFDSMIPSKTLIDGPFMTNGDLDFTGNGNSITGNTVIINGNLSVGINSNIGDASNPVDLYLGGTCSEPLTSGYSSNNIYINNFYHQKVGLQQTVIDNSYIENTKSNGAASVVGSLTINDNGTFSPSTLIQNGSNYLIFSSDKTTLQISGNIVVEGDINIGSGSTIKYEGKGILIATGKIIIKSKLIPKDMNYFPKDNLIVLVSKNKINFDLGGGSGGDIDNPDSAVFAISSDEISISKNNKFIRGDLVGKILDIGNNSNDSTVYYEPGISDFMPVGIPQPNYFLLSQKWEEIPNS